MPVYEGCVIRVHGEGLAEVLIQPQEGGIIGAPHVNVCHAASNSSRVTATAVNRAGADAGDRVSLYRSATDVILNLAALAGMPAAGMLLGLLGFVLVTGNFMPRHFMMWVSGILGLLMGIGFGIILYRRMAVQKPHALVINRILGKGAAAALDDGPAFANSCSTASPARGCEACMRKNG